MQFRQFQSSKEVLMAVFCNEENDQVNTRVYPQKPFNKAIEIKNGLDLTTSATFAHEDVTYENQNQYLEFKGSGSYAKLENLFNDLVAAGYSVYGYGVKNDASAILKMNTFSELWMHEILQKERMININNERLNYLYSRIKSYETSTTHSENDVQAFKEEMENDVQRLKKEIESIEKKKNKLVEIYNQHQNKVDSSSNLTRHSRRV